MKLMSFSLDYHWNNTTEITIIGNFAKKKMVILFMHLFIHSFCFFY